MASSIRECIVADRGVAREVPKGPEAASKSARIMCRNDQGVSPTSDDGQRLARNERRRFVSIRAFTRNHGAVAGLAVLILLSLAALLAPVLAPYDPSVQDFNAAMLGPGEVAHPLGTDSLGRDLLSRIMYGARISLSVAFLSVGLSLIAGVLLGVAAGYVGGTLDTIIMRVIDVLMALPSIILAIAIVAAVGPSLRGVILAISISTLPGFVRLTRAQTISVRQLEYLEAARTIGATSPRIMLRHVMPNISGTLVVQASLAFGSAILLEAGLSFLGLGIPPPTPTWGGMVSEGRLFLFTTPHIGLIPGLFIMFASLAANLVGDGLRDALDPHSSARYAV